MERVRDTAAGVMQRYRRQRAARLHRRARMSPPPVSSVDADGAFATCWEGTAPSSPSVEELLERLGKAPPLSSLRIMQRQPHATTTMQRTCPQRLRGGVDPPTAPTPSPIPSRISTRPLHPVAPPYEPFAEPPSVPMTPAAVPDGGQRMASWCSGCSTWSPPTLPAATSHVHGEGSSIGAGGGGGGSAVDITGDAVELAESGPRRDMGQAFSSAVAPPSDEHAQTTPQPGIGGALRMVATPVRWAASAAGAATSLVSGGKRSGEKAAHAAGAAIEAAATTTGAASNTPMGPERGRVARIGVAMATPVRWAASGVGAATRLVSGANENDTLCYKRGGAEASSNSVADELPSESRVTRVRLAAATPATTMRVDGSLADAASNIPDTDSDAHSDAELDDESVPHWTWMAASDLIEEGHVSLEWKALDEFAGEEQLLRAAAKVVKEQEEISESNGASLETAMVTQAVSEQVRSLHSLQCESLETHTVSVLTAMEALDAMSGRSLTRFRMW